MSFDELGVLTKSIWKVSIPLEQGNVFRLSSDYDENEVVESQSLWNRAMSFDTILAEEVEYQGVSQSLWNRAMSFDCSGVLEPCVARLPRATSQLFLMFE